MLVPHSLTDEPYNGTLSLMRNNAHSARHNRGKYKGNRREPRTRQYASDVTDGQGNIVNIARKRTTRVPRTTRAPQGMTYQDRLMRFGAVGRMDD